jgi:cystathionine beta-lyase
MKRETEWIQYEPAPGDPYAPSTTPLYQTATFRIGDDSDYDYTRSGNPTRTVVADQLARVEGAALPHGAFLLSSGMAAITAACGLVAAGDEILACVDLYGGTYRLLSQIATRQGIRIRYVDTSDPGALGSAFEPAPKLVLVETPSNPFQSVTDLFRLCELAHDAGSLVAVDNSLMSPYLQRPLSCGADLVIHSATKFLNGHSDVTAGVVITNDSELAERIGFYQNATGTALAPFDAWLLARGMKTLPLRLDKQQFNAGLVARYLRAHPFVERVHYVGLPEHPGRDVHERQARGAGAVMAFETGALARSLEIVKSLRLFGVTVSFGGVRSTASLPARMSHASIPSDVRSARRFPEDLVRLSIGIEHIDDLRADLDQALERAVALTEALT